jgi:hypothetical protein
MPDPDNIMSIKDRGNSFKELRRRSVAYSKTVSATPMDLRIPFKLNKAQDYPVGNSVA